MFSDPPLDGRLITAIERQRQDPDRISVFLDGVFAFGLPALLAIDEDIHVGDRLSPEKVVRLQALAEQAKAVGSALNLISRRPRSEREVRDRLKRKGFPPEAIDAAVTKLGGWRYLDDEAFARYWVDNREANRPRGRRLLEQELRQKGVDRETVRQTIETAAIDEHAGALEIARTKLRTYGKLSPDVARRRLAGVLMRRGYGYDVVKPVLDQLFGEAETGDDDESA